jgi:hypothetical protein
MQLDVWTQEVMGLLADADAALLRQVCTRLQSWSPPSSSSSSIGQTCLQYPAPSSQVLPATSQHSGQFKCGVWQVTLRQRSTTVCNKCCAALVENDELGCGGLVSRVTHWLGPLGQT